MNIARKEKSVGKVDEIVDSFFVIGEEKNTKDLKEDIKKAFASLIKECLSNKEQSPYKPGALNRNKYRQKFIDNLKKRGIDIE